MKAAGSVVSFVCCLCGAITPNEEAARQHRCGPDSWLPNPIAGRYQLRTCTYCGGLFLTWASRKRMRITCSLFCQPRSGLQPHAAHYCRGCDHLFLGPLSFEDSAQFCSAWCAVANGPPEIIKSARDTTIPQRRTHSYGRGWSAVRARARERDEYTCQRCGITEGELGHELHVHHIIPFRVSRKNSLRNLICLCPSCHAHCEGNQEDCPMMSHDREVHDGAMVA